MILVDTSAWVDHLRRGNERLRTLLEDGEVASHPFVIGELTLGDLRQHAEILEYLDNLPTAPLARQDEVLTFVERHRLMGTGIGWVDAHLLASSRLGNVSLWTLDKRLAQQARRLGVAVDP